MASNLKDALIEHEGLRLYPYHCPTGKLTIGVGRNIESMGITHSEAMLMLANDVDRCRLELRPFSWYQDLDQVRQDVLVELDFNIGMPRLLKFKRMIKALKEKDYQMAAHELLDSKWAEQVGKNRSNDMAYRLRHGRYQP